eukprot:6179768-Pleurochrysis_carterae.AAC.3
MSRPGHLYLSQNIDHSDVLKNGTPNDSSRKSHTSLSCLQIILTDVLQTTTTADEIMLRLRWASQPMTTKRAFMCSGIPDTH